jgi:hypothetical protein
MLNRKKQTPEEKKAYSKAYYESHKEETKAHSKTYREIKKREREDVLMDTSRQKRQRKVVNDGPIVQDLSNQTSVGIAIQPASISWTKINLMRVNSFVGALKRDINLESNLPEQNNTVSNQHTITPQVTSLDLLFGNTESNPPKIQEQEVEKQQGRNNYFFRDSLTSRQLLFGDRTQKVSISSTQELGQAKLPVRHSDDKEDSYFSELSKFFG